MALLLVFNQTEETKHKSLIIPLFLSISLYLHVAPACIENKMHHSYTI